jgi:hypothetical protein
MLACFVFSTTLCLDGEIGRTIERMGDRRWSVREEATTRAFSYGSIAVPRLKAARRQHPSLEVRKRCGIVLEKWYTVLPSRYPFPDYPSINYLPIHFLELRREDIILENNYIRDHLIPRALAEVNDVNTHPHDKSKYLRYTTKLYVRRLLDAGHPRAKIQELIDEMMYNERRMVAGDQRWWLKEVPPKVAEALKNGAGPRIPGTTPSVRPPR